jgi:GNAT superfamily N-acetyltransferase
MMVRAAERSEIAALAHVWYDGWQDAHAKILPAKLAQLRTLQSFHTRLDAALSRLRTIGQVGAPLGFHLIKASELYQFYVAANARGTGVASLLIQDAEAQLAAAGVTTARLDCAIGNERAARFYAKSGWYRVGEVESHTDTSAGPFTLRVWRYEKTLAVG